MCMHARMVISAPRCIAQGVSIQQTCDVTPQLLADVWYPVSRGCLGFSQANNSLAYDIPDSDLAPRNAADLPDRLTVYPLFGVVTK